MGDRVGRALIVLTVAMVLSPSAPRQASAQSRPRGGGLGHAAGAGVAFVRFMPDDPETPGYFEMSGAAPALVYNRSGMSVIALYKTDDGVVEGKQSDLDMVDVSFLFYGDVTPFDAVGSTGIQPFIPIAVTTAYRRVRSTVDFRTLIVFEYQTLGIGSGLGVRAGGSRWRTEVHATPSIGFASRSFGGSTGLVYGVDSEAWLTTGPVMGRLGLSFGYGFHWQRWRVGGPEAIAVAGSGRFYFTGIEHVLRVGISW